MGAAGVAAMAWGAWGLLLAPHHPSHRLKVLIEVGAAAVIHDGLLAPLALAVAWLLVRVVGPRRSKPVLAGLGLLAAIALASIPVLGRFGAKADNPSALPRDYPRGLLLIAVVTVVVTTLLVLLQRLADARRPAPEPEDAGAGSTWDGGPW